MKVSMKITALTAVVLLSCTQNFAQSDSLKINTTSFTVYKDLPLKPERNISFTTNEGSWMSLDVSPDSKTIVFDLMGDLYSIPITGGKATVITKGLSFDTTPGTVQMAKKFYSLPTEAVPKIYGTSILRKKIRYRYRKTRIRIFHLHRGRPMAILL